MLKKFISLCLVGISAFICLTYPASALQIDESLTNDKLKFSAVSTNSHTKNVQNIDMTVADVKSEQISEDLFTESCDCIFKVDANNAVSVVDSVPPLPRTTLSATDENTYWKASIKITYVKSGGTVKLTKVEGSWTKLRGTSSITYREVTYGQVRLVENAKSGTKYPTSNSFSYDTGFKAGTIVNGKSYVGGRSFIRYTRPGTELELELFCDKSF